MKAIGKIFDVLEKILKNICGALVVGFTGITLVAVIARYVLNSPIWWSEQLCRYLFIWIRNPLGIEKHIVRGHGMA